MVKQFKTDPQIRELAIDIVGQIPGKDWAGEANALFQFVRDDIRYLRDVNGVETLSTPIKTLEYQQGDCDDQVVLLASLLESIGHPTAFVAIGPAPNTFSHVYLQTKIQNQWVGMEPTEQWPMGVRPKMFPYSMVHFN